MARGRGHNHQHEHMRRGALVEPPRVLDLPEVNVLIFSFLLNFVWEFWQAPFFRGMSSAEHWSATMFCSLASVGDAVIALVSFWVVSTVARTRAWVLAPSAVHVSIFVMVGVLITIIAEWVATETLEWWAYGEWMPTLPLLGTGLLPLLQWMILPPIVVWFVRRQLS